MKVLEWKNYESISSSSFKKLYDDKFFTDVTLACDGNKKIEAHKVILSACSNFFQEILQGNENPHPLIYLQGMDIKYLILLKKFIYLGRAMVEQDYILPFVEMSKSFLNTQTKENPQTMPNKPREKQELEHLNSTPEKLIQEQINFSESSVNLGLTENKFLTEFVTNVEQSRGENSTAETTIREQMNIPESSVNSATTENKFVAEVVAKVAHSFKENDSEIIFTPKIEPMSTSDIATSLVTKKEIIPIEFIPRMRQSCLKCKFQSFNSAHLEDHIEKMHSEQICPECGISFEVGKLKAHLRGMHTTYSCKECSFTTEKAVPYYDHKRLHIKDSLIRCDKCEYSSYSNASVKKHREIHNASNEFKCDSCEFMSRTRKEQRYHTKKVHKGVRYECDDCEYSATTGNNLKAHKESVHAKFKTFCRICPFSNSSVSRVSLHEKRNHLKEFETYISKPPSQNVNN